MMETWVQFHLHWLEFKGPLRVVSYEDVKVHGFHYYSGSAQMYILYFQYLYRISQV